jgi:acetyltransferase-like isoleucine patch superfamily enzyme
MISIAKKLIRYVAHRRGRLVSFYRKLCHPGGYEWADFLRRHGRFFSIGEDCSILMSTAVLNPEYVRIGNNVSLSQCTLIGHDGSIAVLNKAYNVKLDRVGKIDIGDNVFVGWGAIIMPGVTIGPNAIVAAGAVVTRNVKPGMIVGGSPAKPIGRVDDFVQKMKSETLQLPWADLIEAREGPFDQQLELELIRRRVSFFYGNDLKTDGYMK